MISEQDNIPTEEISLMYSGSILDESKTLEEYFIQNNSNLFAVISLRGGAKKK